MFEFNPMQWWVVVGVFVVTIDWRIVVWFFGIVENLLMGNSWNSWELPRWKHSLLYWFLKVSGLSLVLWGLPFDTYNGVAGRLAIFAFINLLLTIVWLVAESPHQNKSDHKEHRTLTQWEKVVTCTSAVSLVAFAVGSLFGWFLFGHLDDTAMREAEIVATRSMVESTFDKDGITNRYVLPRKVLKIERQGTTWWEIHPSFDEKTVYQVREAPAHNLLMNRLAESGTPQTRKGLILLSWKQGGGEQDVGGGLRIIAPTQVAMNDQAAPQVALVSVEAVSR